MSYTVCPNCGQNALSVATRCPRCGVAFESQFIQHAPRRPRRVPVGLLLAGAVLTILAGNALWQRFGVAPRTTPIVRKPAPAPVAAPQRRPVRESLAQAPETVRAAPPEAPRVSVTQVAPPPVSHAPNPNAAAVPVATAAPSPAHGAKTLYSSTWLNLRADRRSTAPVLRILRPGEVVRVDSLAQGWYRVVSVAEQPGWVDRRLLDTLPPPSQPTAHE